MHCYWLNIHLLWTGTGCFGRMLPNVQSGGFFATGVTGARKSITKMYEYEFEMMKD